MLSMFHKNHHCGTEHGIYMLRLSKLYIFTRMRVVSATHRGDDQGGQIYF